MALRRALDCLYDTTEIVPASCLVNLIWSIGKGRYTAKSHGSGRAEGRVGDPREVV